MRITIKNSIPIELTSREYEIGKRYTTTRDCVDNAIEILSSSRGREGYWSALDVHYDNNMQKGTWKSLYVLVCEMEGELTLLDGFGRGYKGEGSRGAVAMENFFDVLDLPVHRIIVEPDDPWLDAAIPDPVKLKVSLKKKDIIHNRSLRTGYATKDVKQLVEGMDIEEALRIVNCYR